MAMRALVLHCPTGEMTFHGVETSLYQEINMVV